MVGYSQPPGLEAGGGTALARSPLDWSWWVLTSGRHPQTALTLPAPPGRTARRGPTLLVDGEHQGPVAGVQLHKHGGLDQVLGQVAQKRDGPARQATRGHGRAQDAGQNTASRSGGWPIISRNEAGSPLPKDQIWVPVLMRQQSGFSLIGKPRVQHR